jgi:hypothetical protein
MFHHEVRRNWPTFQKCLLPPPSERWVLIPQNSNFLLLSLLYINIGRQQLSFGKKVKLSRCVIQAPRGREIQLLFILNPNTRWGWVVSVTPRPRFSPVERTPGTYCKGCWVGPRTGLDTEAREKILYLRRGSNPVRPVCSQTLYWLS